jgi:short-subunit dehydrogenase
MPKQRRTREQPFKDRIAHYSGGSKGIGRATAKEIALLGGSVCLIARHREPLEATVREIEEIKPGDSQFVESIMCDTADAERLRPLLTEFIDRRGVPDYLINCVGYARPKCVQELTLEDFQERMEANYCGQLVPILILLPYLMEAQRGHIANVSSMMGFFGIMGYAAYAPTKFALVGLTEVLRHELKPYNISCSVLYPPDTDTPGFQKENETKPPECAELSAGVEMLSAQAVAEVFVEGILKKQVDIMPGEAGMVWRLKRFVPWLVRWVTDRQYEQARRKTASGFVA